MFKVPFSILFEDREEWNVKTNIEENEKLGFSMLSFLSEGQKEWKEDVLYIGLLSQLQKDRGNCYVVCINDTGVETLEEKNMVLFDSNYSREQVFLLLQEKMSEIQDWYYAMKNMLYQGCTMQSLVNVSEEHLKNYVAITDSKYRLLANTKNIPVDDPICLKLIETGVHPAESTDLFNTPSMKEFWKRTFYINDSREVSKYALIGRIFQYEDTYFTHSVMTCNKYEPTDGIVARYKIFLEHLERLVVEAWRKVESFTHVYDALLINIMEGKLKDKRVIEQKSKYVGIQYEGNYVLGSIETTASCDSSAARIAHEVSAFFARSKVLVYGDSVLFLYMFDSGTIGEQLESFIEDAKKFANKFGVKVLVSGKIENISLADVAYSQIKTLRIMLMQISKRPCGLEEYCVEKNCFRVTRNSVYLYDDYYEYSVLNMTDEILAASTHGKYFSALRRIYDYDKKHKLNNLQLLRIYLNTERSLVATAELMHMHRNNVVYRLKKINGMLIGIDLDNPEHRYRILQAYKIYDIQHGILCDDNME